MKSELDQADDVDDDDDGDPDYWNDDDRPLLHSEPELPRKRSARWYVLFHYHILNVPPSYIRQLGTVLRI